MYFFGIQEDLIEYGCTSKARLIGYLWSYKWRVATEFAALCSVCALSDLMAVVSDWQMASIQSYFGFG
jgi:hypothetical protein